MIDFFRIFLLGDISACRYYLDAMDAAVPPARVRALEVLEQQAESEHWGYEDYDAERQGVEGVYDHTLPRVLSRSLLIYLHSRVEVQLGAVARDVRQRHSLTLDFTELSGSVIDRVRIYLEKVAGIPVSDLSHWSTLRDLAKVRDVLVHRGGRVGSDSRERERLRQLTLRYPGLLEVTSDFHASDAELTFGPPLCRHFIHAAYQFFDGVLTLTRPKSV